MPTCFCPRSSYTARRNAMEFCMNKADMDWADVRVYVSSFLMQVIEDDYVFLAT